MWRRSSERKVGVLHYGLSFQPSESLKALIYFNDGDLNALGADEKKMLLDAVKAVRDLPGVTLRSKSLSILGSHLL